MVCGKVCFCGKLVYKALVLLYHNRHYVVMSYNTTSYSMMPHFEFYCILSYCADLSTCCDLYILSLILMILYTLYNEL